uniref:Orange domain-containing protein n=1 Tax=Arundo donax TaxID=35708 RepID=A0A0A9GGG5_ARUDO
MDCYNETVQYIRFHQAGPKANSSLTEHLQWSVLMPTNKELHVWLIYWLNI